MIYDHETLQTSAYFRRLSGVFPGSGEVSSIVVAHMVTNSLHFLPVVDQLAPIKLLLPKPTTASPSIKAELCGKYTNRELSRDWARSPSSVIATLDELSISGDLVFVDIGGYFAPSISEVSRLYSRGRVLGCMEGTENGVDKYAPQLESIDIPIYSVAGSRLKYPENHLVGVSVVHSIESVIRELGNVIQNYRACVIGYGKVGSSVCEALRGRGVPTTVCDSNPVASAEAAARGYTVMSSKKRALAQSNLVVGATGNRSLGKAEFASMKPGSLVATVTSKDDELDLNSISLGWIAEKDSTPQGTPITHYRGKETFFHLLNNGDTINFLHGAVIGPAIQLIEGEKLAAIHAVCTRKDSPLHQINEVSESERKNVAEVWLDHFVRDDG